MKKKANRLDAIKMIISEAKHQRHKTEHGMHGVRNGKQ